MDTSSSPFQQLRPFFDELWECVENYDQFSLVSDIALHGLRSILNRIDLQNDGDAFRCSTIVFGDHKDKGVLGITQAALNASRIANVEEG